MAPSRSTWCCTGCRSRFWPGRPDRKRRFISPQEEDRRLTRIFDHLPVQDIDELLLGERVQFYHEALTSTDRNALRWRSIDLSDRVGNIEAAAHLMTGWHDFMLRELLADYQRLVDADRSPYLTIGPWYHADVRYLGDAIRLASNGSTRSSKGQRAKLRTKPVRVYVMGADEWRDFDAWPPNALRIRYYLREQRHLSIEPPQNGAAPDRYRYDPADPTPNLGGPLINLPKGAVRDNRELEARSDVLVYTTPPLDRDLDVIGPVRLELFARSTLAHTDFFGRLCDVQPNGKSLNVCDGLIRVKPEPPVEHPEHNGRAKRCMRGHAASRNRSVGDGLSLQARSSPAPDRLQRRASALAAQLRHRRTVRHGDRNARRRSNHLPRSRSSLGADLARPVIVSLCSRSPRNATLLIVHCSLFIDQCFGIIAAWHVTQATHPGHMTKPLRFLLYYADTGGGHRATAQAIARRLEVSLRRRGRSGAVRRLAQISPLPGQPPRRHVSVDVGHVQDVGARLDAAQRSGTRAALHEVVVAVRAHRGHPHGQRTVRRHHQRAAALHLPGVVGDGSHRRAQAVRDHGVRSDRGARAVV